VVDVLSRQLVPDVLGWVWSHSGRGGPVVGAVILFGLGVTAMHQRTITTASTTDDARQDQALARRSSLSGWMVLAAAVGVFGAAALVLAVMWDWAAEQATLIMPVSSSRCCASVRM
jgi:hypothetical protein